MFHHCFRPYQILNSMHSFIVYVYAYQYVSCDVWWWWHYNTTNENKSYTHILDSHHLGWDICFPFKQQIENENWPDQNSDSVCSWRRCIILLQVTMPTKCDAIHILVECLLFVCFTMRTKRHTHISWKLNLDTCLLWCWHRVFFKFNIIDMECF